MKGKKFTVILTALMLACCCFFTSCQVLIDVAPTAYAEWDGNYIYRGNVRSKTTGEEEKYLLETVTYNEVTYTVAEMLDYAYFEDDIYMCLSLGKASQEAGKAQMETCAVVYDTKEKSYSVLYWPQADMGVSGIYKMTEEYVVLWVYEKNGQGNEAWIRIDYNGNVLNERNQDFITKHEADEYFVWQENGQFYCCTWEDTTPVPMFAITGAFEDFKVQYYEKGAHKGIMVQIYSNYQYNSGLYFYDVAQKKTTILIAFENDLRYNLDDALQNNYADLDIDYLVAGTLKEKDYTETYVTLVPLLGLLPIFVPEKRIEEETYSGLTNCILYQINWSGESVALDVVYDFSKEYSELDFSCFYRYQSNMNFKENQLYFDVLSLNIIDGVGCLVGSGPKYDPYLFDIETKTLKKTKESFTPYDYSSTDEEILRQNIEEGVTCGQYVYFLDSDYYSANGWNDNAYTFYRYDTKTEKVEAMQFFVRENYNKGSRVEKVTGGEVTYRYSVKMWAECAEISYYMLNNDFIVRNY